MAEQKKENRRPEGHQKADHGKRFLLVVDGNAHDCYYTGILLQQFGYNVVSFQTARQALEIMEEALPALIIIDPLLPGTRESDLFTEIKKSCRTAGIPIICLAPAGDRQAEKRCRDAGCAGYFRKPVQAEELYRAVQSAIEQTPRKSLRITTRLKAVIRDFSGPADASETGLVTALSEFGMFVTTMNPRPVQSRLQISIAVGSRVVMVEAVVLYSYPPGEILFRDPGMGMKFEKIKPDDQKFLRSYIEGKVTEGIT